MNETLSQTPMPGPASANFFWRSLSRFWDFLTAPHPSISEVGARRQARLVATLSLILCITLTLGMVGSSSANKTGFSPTVYLLGMLNLGSLFTYILGRTKLYALGAVIAILTLSAFSYGEVVMIDVNIFRAVLTTVPLAILFAIALLPVWAVLLVTLFNIVATAAMPLFVSSVTSEEATTTWGLVLTFGALAAIVSGARNSIERDRLAEIKTANQKLAEMGAGLEQRVADRTTAIALAAEVGRRVAQVQDTNQLLAEAVELIRDRFDLYYVQVYLANPAEHTLSLKAGSGDVGKTLLSRAHNLLLDQTSINGSAAANQQPVLVTDTSTSRLFRPNPLLPETRSEMAIPIIASDRVLGVLDLQSRIPGSLSQEDLPAYQVLAGQLATSLVNAGLFSQLEESLRELENRTRASAQIGWSDYLDAIHQKERFSFTLKEGQVTSESETLPEQSGTNSFDLPIQVAGAQIGSFHLESSAPWTEDDTALVEFIATQTAQQLDNLHLISQAQRYRDEAEATLRRLTGGSWQEYMKDVERGQLGFEYDHETVENTVTEQPDESQVLEFELKVQESPIGQIQIAGMDALSPEETGLVQAISEQLSAHLENMRLFNTAQRELDDRRLTEEALLVSQTQYALATQGANDGIWDWNLVTGEQYMAPRWKGQIGYAPDELENSFEEFNSRLHPEDAERVNQAVQDYLEGRSPTYEVEFRLRHKDGSYRWILARGIAGRDENGKPIRMAGSHMDITDRKELEETLRQDRVRLTEALEAAKMANWEFDLTRGVFIFNDDMFRMLKTSIEVEGSYEVPAPVFLQKFVHPEDQARLGSTIQQGMANPQEDEQLEISFRNICADGEIMPVITRYRFGNKDHNPTRVSGATQDVTVMVRQQELTAQRAAELATVAEVSTIITTILDPDQMLQQVVDMTKERFNFYHAHIYILDGNGENLVLRAGASEVGRQMVKQGRSIPLHTEKSLVARTARGRKGILVNDVYEDPEFLSHPLLPNTAAEMAVPLLAGDQLLGVLDIQGDTAGRFTEENINVLTTLASQVAVSLQNTRSYVRAQQQAERESLINAISERIQSTTSVESALQVAVRELGRALGAQRTVIQLGLQHEESTRGK